MSRQNRLSFQARVYSGKNCTTSCPEETLGPAEDQHIADEMLWDSCRRGLSRRYLRTLSSSRRHRPSCMSQHFSLDQEIEG